MRILIITGGSIEDNFAAAYLQNKKYDYTIVADSGMEACLRLGLTPDLIAGDFDSVSEKTYAYFCENAEKTKQIRLNPVKDDTDTEFVLRYAMDMGADEITLLGATGSRLDHVIANISLLGLALSTKCQMEIVDSHNRIRMICGELSILRKEQFGNYVSILPVGREARGVTLRGFAYPLEEATLSLFSSLGVSNEIVEDRAEISVKEGALLVIESRD